MTQKHAILGFGVTGQSVARHLLANAKECMVFDTRPSRLTPKEFEQLAIHWQIADWSKQQMADQLGHKEGYESGKSFVFSLVGPGIGIKEET